MSTAPLDGLVRSLLESYGSDPRGNRVGKRFIPSRTEIVACVELLLELVYPGYFGGQDLTDENVAYAVGVTLDAVRRRLGAQVEACIRYDDEHANRPQATPEEVRVRAQALTDAFLARLPDVRRLLIDDVQAAFDGDPAATNLDEVILAYPGMLAVTVQRLAHELQALGVHLLPRMMTEWAHSQTGADIHPGAHIGRSFFMDHATGVVVGETTDIGVGVKLYQGVTLGALSHPRDEQGRVIRGQKRHPTVEDGVTIYANATVLGGETVVGKGSLVGANVFMTQGVPPGSRVAIRPPELRVKTADGAEVDGEPSR
ncbi:MAG: serine acetyltransferase [Deltaproteobacteria bacterium]|nr:serine acetyltransferase [Deltaproteobacteria bacterium]